jgi:hypothetical protein
MAWKKIDDYNSGDTGTVYQPYSAFLAQGLTQNARSYPSELTRGASIPWRRDKPPRWASYHEPAGTVVWVNCGANASRINFRIQYDTVNAHESAEDRIGVFYIQSLSNNRTVTVDVPANVGGTPLTIEFTAYSGGYSGYQAFFIGFQSDKVFDLGLVDVNYLSANTIGLLQVGGAGAYPVTTGEKYELLVWEDNSYVIQAANPDIDLEWQLGFVRKDPNPADSANGVIFPANAIYPVPMTVYTQNDKDASSARVWELGAPRLYSISYVVIEAEDYTPPDQFNHYHALALSSVNSAQTQAIPTFRPELANNQCDPYKFGRVVTAAPDALTSTFCVQTDVTGRVQIAMTVFPLNVNATSAVIRYDILDSTGASIFGGQIIEPFRSPGFTPSYSLTPTVNQSRALIGVFAAELEWGMRDALPQSDIQKGTQVVFEFPEFSFDSVGSGVVGVYTIRIEFGIAHWVIAYSARLI